MSDTQKEIDPQKEIQRIYEENLYTQKIAAEALGAKAVQITLTMDEMRRVCDFFAMFAYD